MQKLRNLAHLAIVHKVGLQYTKFFLKKHFQKGSLASDTVLLWNCFMNHYIEPDYKQNLFPVSIMARRPSHKPIFLLNAPNYQLIALAWCNWLMHLSDTKSEWNSTDNCKLSSEFQAIYIANQILDMLSIYPNVLELIKPTTSEWHIFCH